MGFENAKKELKMYVYEKQYYTEVVLEIKKIETEIAKILNKINSYNDDEYKKVLNKQALRFRNIVLRKTEKLKDSEAFMEMVENTINQINQPLKNVLYFRYVNLYKYSAIAIKMGYSLQRIFQLNRQALIKYDEIMKNRRA